jgi:hypothetical protein
VDRIVGPRKKSLRIAEECDSGPSLIAAISSEKGITISASILETASGRRLRIDAVDRRVRL